MRDEVRFHGKSSNMKRLPHVTFHIGQKSLPWQILSNALSFPLSFGICSSDDSMASIDIERGMDDGKQ